MGDIYLISDTHFGDSGAILRYEGRPFQDGREMNEQMIENWNRVAGAEDTVYHLGDFACYLSREEIKEIANRLNGRNGWTLASMRCIFCLPYWRIFTFCPMNLCM